MRHRRAASTRAAYRRCSRPRTGWCARTSRRHCRSRRGRPSRRRPSAPGVILDEEPVANVGALAVDRYRLAREALDDGEWHELLGEMVGAERQWAKAADRSEKVPKTLVRINASGRRSSG